MNADQPLQVIYLGGYGRSGSSLLDQLLAERLKALGAGELCQLFAWAEEGRHCACGVSVLDCRYWGPVLHEVLSETDRSLGDLGAITAHAEMRGERTDEWQRIWTVTFEAMRARGTDVVIDSSKTAGGRNRVRLLRRLPAVRLRLFIALHRSLPAVIHSRRRGNNRTLERDGTFRSVNTRSGGLALDSLRATIGWVRANRVALSEARQTPRHIQISYEQLTTDPEVTIAAIANEADISGSVSAIDRTHAIAGNRMLRASWNGEIAPDHAWQNELPLGWKAWGLLVAKVFATRLRARASWPG